MIAMFESRSLFALAAGKQYITCEFNAMFELLVSQVVDCCIALSQA